jgi:hypothetical protein
MGLSGFRGTKFVGWKEEMGYAALTHPTSAAKDANQLLLKRVQAADAQALAVQLRSRR